jgi:serine/threonine-protein kinase
VPPAPPRAATSGTGAPVVFNGAPIGGMPLGGLQPGNSAVGNAPLSGVPLGGGAPGRGGSGAPSPYGAPAYQANTQANAAPAYPAPAYAATDYPRYAGSLSGEHAPTANDIARWESPQVVAFRKKLAPYLFVNGAIFVVSIFGGKDWLGFSTLWTVYIAWKYAKLWSDGYDWKDVLRQPRHRMFGEVLSDITDSIQATFSRSKREELRAQGRLRNRLSGVLTPILPGSVAFGAPQSPRPLSVSPDGASRVFPSAPVRDDDLGEYLATVRGARSDRDEISRLLATIPANEKSRIANVAATSVELVSKIESIAVDLARTDRELGANRAATMDAEIAALEAEANPLDTQRSEGRVRRLAQLRRDRRGLADALRKRETRRGQLESCRIALENVRLDLVRLRTGNSSVQSVTQVAEQAMALARDVDIAVSAANEVRDATRSRPSGTPA